MVTQLSEDRDLYNISSEEVVELIKKYDIKPIMKKSTLGRMVYDLNEYEQHQYQVSHGCGHTVVIGSWERNVVRFVRDSMESELTYCFDCQTDKMAA